jgi:hydroxymethylglutaryl-CoA reductase
MVSRGGGIQSLMLVDKSCEISNYFQLHLEFNTSNAMGANYMNSCLELIARKLSSLASEELPESEGTLSVLMSILSNYSPKNAVRVYTECPLEMIIDKNTGMSAEEFASRFELAVRIAQIDVNRAVTHNKGIYNGIDAVILATGNDWRAIEANGHAYASSKGRYRSLSEVHSNENSFRFEMTIPMQLGTVGGITSLHPMSVASFKLLKNPSAEQLMSIVASVGLASHFAAISSLVTSGIQKGHMKMHLVNILSQLQATDDERTQAIQYFAERIISHSAVEKYINSLRE